MEIGKELLTEAKKCTTASEIAELATKNGITISEEEANEIFENFNKTGEMKDDELDNVAGGGCGSTPTKCPKCKSGNISKKNEQCFTHYHCYACQYDWRALKR